ncbi:hypothetical protein JHK87_050563 [Glycine soja]|nr:hypothetical protein JHK87_050563 [Glycine soja]
MRCAPDVHISHLIKTIEVPKTQVIKQYEVFECHEMREHEGSKRGVLLEVHSLNTMKNGITSSTMRNPHETRMRMGNLLWLRIVAALVFSFWVDSFSAYEYHHFNETEFSLLESQEQVHSSLLGRTSVMVGLTVIQSAAGKGADFFNWNRVKIRYCDGASFAGDAEDKVDFDVLELLKIETVFNYVEADKKMK